MDTASRAAAGVPVVLIVAHSFFCSPLLGLATAARFEFRGLRLMDMDKETWFPDS